MAYPQVQTVGMFEQALYGTGGYGAYVANGERTMTDARPVSDCITQETFNVEDVHEKRTGNQG